MSRSVYCRFLCLLVLMLCAGLVYAAEPAAKKKPKPAAEKKATPAAAKKAEPAAKKAEPAAEKKAEPPATVTIKRSPLRVTVELDGVFEGDAAHEITVQTEEWPALVLESAAPHGAVVRKGDVLLKLETDKLDRTIADLRADLKVSELAMHQAKDQLQSMEKALPVELEQGRRSARVAEEDRQFFFEVAKPFDLKAVEFELKMAKVVLEYQQEELRQLEKMYKADDITEETEEIVLRRARDNVEQAKFMLEFAQLNHDHALKFDLPRKEEQVNEAAKRTALDWEKNKAALPLAPQRLRLEMEKLRLAREQSQEKLQRLLADRKLMTVVAPTDGIVYYGKLVRGKASDATALGEALRPHGPVPPNQVLMTVVEPRPMNIRATVPEGDLHDVRPGLTGTAVPTGYPDLELSSTIDTVSDIPISPGNFDGRLTVDLEGKTKLLRPGMTCKVKLVPYRKTEAICVPPKALVTDELDEHKHSVQVLEKDGKITTRPVTIGRKTDKQVEILKGLEEGEKVVLEPEKDQK